MPGSLQYKSARWVLAFYKESKSWQSRLSERLHLSSCGAWVERRFSKAPSLLALELFVAFALSVYYFFLVCPQSQAPRSYDKNEINLYLFTRLSSDPYPAQRALIETFTIWQARLPGQILSGWVDNQAFRLAYGCFQAGLIHSDRFHFAGYEVSSRVIAFGFYHALWLWLLFLLLIFYRRDALLLMLGVFAGLMYNFIIPAGQWFYPWDLPAMFFFTWACLLFGRGQLWGLLAVVLVGGLFKETVFCGALLLLFHEPWSLGKRLLGFVCLLAAGLLARKLLMTAYGVHTMLFAANAASSWPGLVQKTCWELLRNSRLLFSLQLNHVALANAGTLVLLVLVPGRTRWELALKCLALCFMCGQVLCGSIAEFRIWYEVLPLGWILLSDSVLSRSPSFQSGSCSQASPSRGAPPSRKQRLLLGGHWLVVSLLLALAAAVWLLSNTRLPARLKPISPVTSETTSSFASEYRMTHSELEAAANEILKRASSGQVPEAIGRARQLVRLYPREPAVLNALALLLATSSQPELCNCREAVLLATRAAELTGYREASCVGTLATACAQDGQLRKAASLARKARDLARFNCQKDLVPVYQHLLEAFAAQGQVPPLP